MFARRTLKKKANAVMTEKKSLQLVLKVMRISFHTVAALRGIFPENCFKTHSYQGIKHEGLKSNTGNEQVETYHNWIEQGLQDALNKGYLDKCFLEIYKKENVGTFKLTELYMFHVRYTDQGAEVYLSQSDTSNPSETKQAMKDNVKDIVGTLFNITSDFDPLPTKRMISMRLFYNERAPDDYQAPVFRASEDTESLVIRNAPNQISCGSLSTPHHKADLFVLRDDENAEKKSMESEQESDGIFFDEPEREDIPMKLSSRKSRLKRKKPDSSDDDDFESEVSPKGAAKHAMLQAKNKKGTGGTSTAKARKNPMPKKKKFGNVSSAQAATLRFEKESKPRSSSQVRLKPPRGAAKRGGSRRTPYATGTTEHTRSQARTATLWAAFPTSGSVGIARKKILQG